jgi:hypothetical protein
MSDAHPQDWLGRAPTRQIYAKASPEFPMATNSPFSGAVGLVFQDLSPGQLLSMFRPG